MRFEIKDFTDRNPVQVGTLERGQTHPMLVTVVQDAGGMRFLHPMRADQARFMATALVMAAEQIENERGTSCTQP